MRAPSSGSPCTRTPANVWTLIPLSLITTKIVTSFEGAVVLGPAREIAANIRAAAIATAGTATLIEPAIETILALDLHPGRTGPAFVLRASDQRDLPVRRERNAVAET